MLPRLILFLLVMFVAYGGFRWWKARKLIGSGGLNVIEMNQLMKLAKRSQRLDAALKMRVLIVDAASEGEKANFAEKVDTAIRRLAKQEELHHKISAALDGIDKKALAAKVDDARVDAEVATDFDERDRKQNELRGLETQAEQVDKLEARKQELHDAAEHIMVEIKNLHLALLDASSSKASLENDAVKMALAELEDSAETLRQETAAEEEVNRILRVAATRSAALPRK